MDRTQIAHDITISLIKDCKTPKEAVEKYYELYPTVKNEIDIYLKNQPNPIVGANGPVFSFD